ncbi:hypothetical protein NF556_07845 [Ornithinimicrobium faecis]|uniref:Uncharacterized protein n=1 Tax=Ornithinimicrobium faecis TaxID=2934158 RepID=A0ABY4YY22_9MICO|nr:hypothetical protein [Ornithinimicrobium sp. HY1793]USQ81546.1 hypothetical protein NF556_07845 [Ornithinimicrobium sp. HY1793]
MTAGQNAPILMGAYRFPKLLTSKSEPVILGVLPGRVWLTGQGGVFFDAPVDQITAKANSTVGHVTLEVDGTKHIIAGVGSAKGGPFSPEQLQELQDSQQGVAADPTTQSLMAGRALFVGTPGKVDGTYHGGIQSLAGREIGQQRDFGEAMRELLTAVGVKL